eukprot:6688-Eustigmatos_ZCMA.PRE.1
MTHLFFIAQRLLHGWLCGGGAQGIGELPPDKGIRRSQRYRYSIQESSHLTFRSHRLILMGMLSGRKSYTRT